MEEPSTSQSLAPSLNYTMGLPLSSPGQTSDTGCKQPVSWVDPLDLRRVSPPRCLRSCFLRGLQTYTVASPPSSRCPSERWLLTGLPRRILGLVHRLARGCPWTEPVPWTWLCPPCSDAVRLRPMGEGAGSAPGSWLQQQSADTRPEDVYV